MDDKCWKVLYDDRGFRMKFGGIPRYFTEVIKRLPIDFVGIIAANRAENLYLQQPPFNMPVARKEFTRQDFSRYFLGGRTLRGLDHLWGIVRRVCPEMVRADRVINDRLFARMSRDANIDLIHLTEPHYFNYPWRKWCKGKKLIVTVHDLIPDMVWKYDWMYPYRKRVLECADRIIAVSNYTKQQIVDFYAIAADKIDVVYHGYMEYGGEDCHPLFNDRYILYVGNRNSYKNFTFFVKSIAPLLIKTTDLYLVCTGPKFNLEEVTLFKNLGISSKVIHRFVQDYEMKSLFANAEMFVYPSKVEGFGIPILDAFAAGCPTILAKCSCFPEIAGDAALYFEDGDGDGLCNSILSLLGNEGLKRTMIAQGRARLGNFSWQKCANETATVYKKVLL